MVFFFKILARCIKESRITAHAWREIHSLANYLLYTRELGLTLIRTDCALVKSPCRFSP
jgi:hypothetical protein